VSQIYAIIPSAQQSDINSFFVAYGWGTGTFGGKLTIDNPATVTSSVTHHHSYNASAAPGDFSLFALAKAGMLPENNMNGDPIPYGVGGVVTEAAALAAFAALQLWANDSDENAYAFAVQRRAALGLSMVPEEI
jgi:hypothetical protein